MCFRSDAAFVSVSVCKSSTAASVLAEVLSQLDRQVKLSSRDLELRLKFSSNGDDTKQQENGWLVDFVSLDTIRLAVSSCFQSLC